MTRKATAPVAIETVPIHRGQWIDLVLRMDIPTQRKAVAFALSRFASPDGTRVFPGQKKVADMANLHVTNTRAHIRALVAVGMLAVVKRGGGRNGDPHVYRLTRPADISTLPLWLDPDMERYEDNDGDGPKEYRASALGETDADETEQEAPALGDSVDNSADAPVDNPETPSADALHSDSSEALSPSVSGTFTERWRYPTNPVPTQDQPNTPLGYVRRPRHLRLSPPSTTRTRRRRIPSHHPSRRPTANSTPPAPPSPRCAVPSPTPGCAPPAPTSKPRTSR